MKLFTAAIAMTLALAPMPRAIADEVVTRDGFHVGELSWTAKGVRVADRELAWADVVALRRELPPAPSSGSAVTLLDGERWAVEVVELAAGQLRVRMAGGAERSLPLERVAVLELTPVARAAVAEAADGTLLTRTGEALPGELMWVNEAAVAVESVFGVMQMPRERVAAFVFRQPGGADATIAADRVTLADGTVLRGTLTPGADGPTLDHAVLGAIALEPDKLRAIHCGAVTGTPLGTLTPRLEARPLLTLPMPPAPPTATEPRLLLWPGGKAVYALERAATFRALAASVDGARGPTTLRISSGGKMLLDRVIQRDATPEWLTVQAPAGELTVEAEFIQPLAIPSGIVLREPSLEPAP